MSVEELKRLFKNADYAAMAAAMAKEEAINASRDAKKKWEKYRRLKRNFFKRKREYEKKLYYTSPGY